MFLRKFEVALSVTTTSAGGTDTAYSDRPVNGLIHSINYTTGTTVFSSSANIAITGEGSGQTIFTTLAAAASWVYYPRSRAIVDTTGDVINPTSAGGSESNTEEKIPIVDERIKVVVTNTTAAQDGTVTVYVEGA